VLCSCHRFLFSSLQDLVSTSGFLPLTSLFTIVLWLTVKDGLAWHDAHNHGLDGQFETLVYSSRRTLWALLWEVITNRSRQGQSKDYNGACVGFRVILLQFVTFLSEGLHRRIPLLLAYSFLLLTTSITP